MAEYCDTPGISNAAAGANMLSMATANKRNEANDLEDIDALRILSSLQHLGRIKLAEQQENGCNSHYNERFVLIVA